jgi:hypothetical protein
MFYNQKMSRILEIRLECGLQKIESFSGDTGGRRKKVLELFAYAFELLEQDNLKEERDTIMEYSCDIVSKRPQDFVRHGNDLPYNFIEALLHVIISRSLPPESNEEGHQPRRRWGDRADIS